jgi:hypothetical protein
MRRAGLEAPLLLGIELRRLPLLVGVDRGPVVAAALEGGEAGRAHEPQLGQLAHATDVHRAPVAALLARREADRVAVVVDAPAHAVDPAEAQRLIDRLGPRDAGPP